MATKTKKPDRVRLSLEVSRDVKERLEKLQAHGNAPSLTDVVRRSVALYDLLLEHEEKGGKIVLRDESGADEVIKVLFI